MFQHTHVFFAFIQYLCELKDGLKNYMVLCNPFPTVKKTKILIKIMWYNYLAIKNYIVQYKLQYSKCNGE